jgi:hypothetical protein
MIGAPAQVIYDCGSVAPVVASKPREIIGKGLRFSLRVEALIIARRGT